MRKVWEKSAGEAIAKEDAMVLSEMLESLEKEVLQAIVSTQSMLDNQAIPKSGRTVYII